MEHIILNLELRWVIDAVSLPKVGPVGGFALHVGLVAERCNYVTGAVWDKRGNVVMDGGIIVPSEPEAQIVPMARFWS